MKLISYSHAGADSYGVVTGGSVLDLQPLLGPQIPDLKALIAQGQLDRAAELARTHPASLPLSSVSLLPVIPNPGKIVCVGLNYGEHVRETGRTVTLSVRPDSTASCARCWISRP